LEETEESRRAHLAAEAAKAKAEALVLLGELPDADVRPPDNVLFVCKLNPTTTGRSLAMIFSRFGKVISSDVVHDRHGQSLCYAFVEFDDRDAAEEAYLKMQNVLIDDRRIHVDFCQSVSKTEHFRAAGGWKKFFADRARGFNAPTGGTSGGSLELKRGGHLPLQFSHSAHRPPNHQQQNHGNQRQQQTYRSREGPRYGDDRQSYDEDLHQPSYHRHLHHDDHPSRSSTSTSHHYDEVDRIQYDRRAYEGRQYRHHNDFERHDRPEAPSRKRPGSPIRDDSPHKRSKHSDSSRDSRL